MVVLICCISVPPLVFLRWPVHLTCRFHSGPHQSSQWPLVVLCLKITDSMDYNNKYAFTINYDNRNLTMLTLAMIENF